MKGNHNSQNDNRVCRPVVFNISKIQNERKSQQKNVNWVHLDVVFNISKIQNERKSQLAGVCPFAKRCCVQHIKDTK